MGWAGSQSEMGVKLMQPPSCLCVGPDRKCKHPHDNWAQGYNTKDPEGKNSVNQGLVDSELSGTITEDAGTGHTLVGGHGVQIYHQQLLPRTAISHFPEV